MTLPPIPWLYGYALPNDCMDVRYLLASQPATGGATPLTTASNTVGPAYGFVDQNAFAVAYSTDTGGNPIQVILTNISQAQCVYTVNQSNPTVFDSLFEQALVSALGAFLVPALALNIELMKMSIKVAEQAIEIARVRDGDEGTVIQDHIPDWLRARNSGGGYAWNSDGTLGSDVFYSPVWPGGF